MNSTTRQGQQQRRGGRNNLSDLEWLAKGFRKHVGHIARIVRYNTKETMKKQALSFQQQLDALRSENEALREQIRQLKAEKESLPNVCEPSITHALDEENLPFSLDVESTRNASTPENQQQCCLNNVKLHAAPLFTTNTDPLVTRCVGIVKMMDSHPVPCDDPQTPENGRRYPRKKRQRRARSRRKQQRKNAHAKQDPGSCDVVAYQQSKITIELQPSAGPKTRHPASPKTHSFFQSLNDNEETEPVSITYVNDLSIQCVHCDTKCEQYYFSCGLCDIKSCQYCITSGASKCEGGAKKKFKEGVT